MSSMRPLMTCLTTTRSQVQSVNHKKKKEAATLYIILPMDLDLPFYNIIISNLLPI